MHYFGDKEISTLLLINPDNPTGNFIRKDELFKIAEWCERKSLRFILDESFVDFSDNWQNNTMLCNELLEKYPHMVVIKSISKSYGVPGLRLGILCSSDKLLISNIKKKVSIWNLNSFAEYFMQIFNKYEKDYVRACNKFVEERNNFKKELESVNFLRVMPSQANYFLCELLPPYKAESLVIQMLKRFNILIRDCSSKIGLDGKQYLRIAVRDHKDNTKLVEALKSLE